MMSQLTLADAAQMVFLERATRKYRRQATYRLKVERERPRRPVELKGVRRAQG